MNPEPSTASSTTRELVDRLCEHGHRQVGTPAHEAARNLLQATFEARGYEGYGGTTWDLPYTVYDQDFHNLIPEIPGANPSLPPIFLGAHYDTVPSTPGATDNAASIAVALAVADRILEQPLERSLVLGIFDAEEPPYFQTDAMGSCHFVDHQLDDRGVATMIALDLIGTDPDLSTFGDTIANLLPTPLQGLGGGGFVHDAAIDFLADRIGVLGAEDDKRWHKVIESASFATRRYTPIQLPHRIAPDMSDHYAFRRRGHSYLFLSSGMTEHYHQPSDTPDTLSWSRIDDTARFVEALVRQADTVF